MANLSLRNLYKIYPGGVTAVDNLSLEIGDKKFIVFVGPSGCGKTTTLRMIAGLEAVTKGDLFMDGKRINNMLPKDRDMAMVFQNYALYPHMSVYDNIAFGLKLRKVPKQEIKTRVMETARMLEIDYLLSRKPKALSGGQRQRVAMGRAIVRNPNVFLLDEPLSNLDAALRDQIRTELISLYKRLATTFIYVTHDQTEAITLGTKIVVMKDGIIQQADTPDAVYSHPANMFVAGFIGSPKMNFIKAGVEKLHDTAMLAFAGQHLPLAQEKSAELLKAGLSGQEIVLGIRPEHVFCFPEDGPEQPHMIPAKRDITEMRGADSILHLNCAGSKILARMKTSLCKTLSENCRIHLPPEKIHLFRPGTGNLIA